MINVKLQNTTVEMKVDTGSQANLINYAVFNKLKDKVKLQNWKPKIISYSGKRRKIVEHSMQHVV